MAAPKERWRRLAASVQSTKPQQSSNAAGKSPQGSFGLLPIREADPLNQDPQHQSVVYSLHVPSGAAAELVLKQRRPGLVSLTDHQVAQRFGVDNTGVVGLWPSGEVLAHYCLQRPEIFKTKRVLELGAGYGVAGMAVAACTEAAEVVLTDGNPQVLDTLRCNVQRNKHLFGKTVVRVHALRWGDDASLKAIGGPFDVIIAADCTFFKDHHSQLATTIKSLLARSPSPSTSATKQSTEDKPIASPDQEHEHVADLNGETDQEDVFVADLSGKRGCKDEFQRQDALENRLSTEISRHEAAEGRRKLSDCQSKIELQGVCDTQSQHVRASDVEGMYGSRGSDVQTSMPPQQNGQSKDDAKRESTREIGSCSQIGCTRDIEVEPHALLVSPQRGGTLDRFVAVAREAGILVSVRESFEEVVDEKNELLKGGNRPEWPGYTADHCRPILLELRHALG